MISTRPPASPPHDAASRRQSRAISVAVVAGLTAGCSLVTSFDHFDDDAGASSAAEGGSAAPSGDDAGRDGAPYDAGARDGASGVEAGGGGGPGDATAGDSAPSGVNGCDPASYADRRDISADRTVSGPADSKPGRYNPPCIRIRTGELVRFNTSALFYNDGDYWVAHPLVAYGGDPGSPISAPTTGSSDQYTSFAAPGTFGFRCANHPDQERGAVLVER